jgi:ABC-type sugar transport system ATPase subunit
VELVEPLGSEVVVHIRTEAGEVRARGPAGARPSVGETIHVTAAREHVHLFDHETGERRAWT